MTAITVSKRATRPVPSVESKWISLFEAVIEQDLIVVEEAEKNRKAQLMQALVKQRPMAQGEALVFDENGM